jgi:hypothetical protein
MPLSTFYQDKFVKFYNIFLGRGVKRVFTHSQDIGVYSQVPQNYQNLKIFNYNGPEGRQGAGHLPAPRPPLKKTARENAGCKPTGRENPAR